MCTRKLNCLIEGESDVFVVPVGPEDVVSELKELIQSKRAQDSLKNVGPHTLELWKLKDYIAAEPDDTLANRIEHLVLDLSKFADKLGPTRTVFSIFPTQPPREYIHIIVKVPRTISPERLFKRPRLDDSPPHTPPKIQAGTVEAKCSPPRLDRQQTEIKMAAALAGFEKYFEYLATGELDGYLDSVRPENKLGKFGVVLPPDPILLIHDLGKHTDQNRIKDLFECNREDICDIVHLFSVSGSGKTRLSLDGLCSHWGLYISCKAIRGTASGSSDFRVATEMLQTMGQWQTSLANNSIVAQRTFAMLLCARVFILKQLMQRFPVNTRITDARRRWVLAQVLPPRLSLESKDLFVKVLQVLRGAEFGPLLDIARDILSSFKTDLFPSNKPLVIVIDEAQMAAEYLTFFPSTSTNELRPILREMVYFFRSCGIFKRIILSGTGLSMEMVKDAVGSFSAKQVPDESQGVFTDVGRFTREGSSQEAYIRRYLTLSDNDISDKRLLERMKYWFSGRYRLTASLIELFLHSENVPRHRVLTSFAEHLTGFKITDAIELEAGEPPISPNLDTKIKTYRSLTDLGHIFKEGGLSNRMQLINCLTDALMRWTLGSELTSIPITNNMHEMIALGVGFLDTMPHIRSLKHDVNLPVYISEPLVVLSLRSLFEKQGWTTMKEWAVRLFRNASNSSTLGFMLETVLPLVLMETFGEKFCPLEEAFIFKPGSSLGSRRVTLVSLKRVASGELQTCPVSWNEGSSDRLGLKAETPAHVLEFFDNPDGKIFLFPDNHMRPDLAWFFQDEETKELILCFDQSKLTLNSQTWKKAIESLTPQLFYTMVRKGEQVQYAPMLYPDLLNDLKMALKMALGEDGDAPEVVQSYLTRVQSKTTNWQSLSTSRKTPRFLRIISSPDDDQKQRLDGKDDLVLLRWDKVKNYIGSTADSVVKIIGSVVP